MPGKGRVKIKIVVEESYGCQLQEAAPSAPAGWRWRQPCPHHRKAMDEGCQACVHLQREGTVRSVGRPEQEPTT